MCDKSSVSVCLFQAHAWPVSCDLFFDQSMHWSRFSRADSLTARELNYKFSVWSQRQMRQTTDRLSPKKNVAQFWDRVFSPFQIKTSHFNTVTCRTVRQVTFYATSRSCTDKGCDKSLVSGQTDIQTEKLVLLSNSDVLSKNVPWSSHF